MNFFDVLANVFRPIANPILVLIVPGSDNESSGDLKNSDGYAAFNNAREQLREPVNVDPTQTSGHCTSTVPNVGTNGSGAVNLGTDYSSNLSSLLTNSLFLNFLNPFFILLHDFQKSDGDGGKLLETSDGKGDGSWCSRPADHGHAGPPPRTGAKDDSSEPKWTTKSTTAPDKGSDDGDDTPTVQNKKVAGSGGEGGSGGEVDEPTNTPVKGVPVTPSGSGSSGGATIQIDPNNWKLTLPTDKDGGTSGSAREIKGDALTGFSNENYFTDESSGKLVFTADAEGALTSSNTKYTRSELRERIDGEDAAWTKQEGGALSAKLSVDRMSTEKDGDASRVIVGQIHGKDDELCRLYYNSDGEIYFANEITGSDGEERLFNFENAEGERPNVGLGEEWSYKIEVKDGKLDVAIEVDGEVYNAVPTDGVDPTDISEKWDDDTFYFKAGVYNQVNGIDGHEAQGSGETTASFSALDVGHGGGAGLGAWMAEGLTWE